MSGPRASLVCAVSDSAPAQVLECLLPLAVFLCLSLLGTAKSLLSLKQLQLPSAPTPQLAGGPACPLPLTPHPPLLSAPLLKDSVQSMCLI